ERDKSHYRAAAICPRAAQKARVTDVFGSAPPATAGRTRPERGVWVAAASSYRCDARLARRADCWRDGVMSPVDFSAFVDELATASGGTLLPFFRTSLSIENKHLTGGFDPVTAADRAAEAAMRALIHRTFPEHGIIGE